MSTTEKKSDTGSGSDRLLYRPRNFADRTDLSPSMVYKLMASGEIRSVRVGRSIRIPASELQRLVAGETLQSSGGSRGGGR